MSETVQVGIVHSSENCPHCKSSLSVILETHVTGEQVGNCGSCGYSFVRKVLLGDNSQPIMDQNGQFIYTVETLDNPFGAVHIIEKANIAPPGEEPQYSSAMYSVPSEEEFNRIVIPYIEEFRHEIQEATLSQFIDGQIILKSILNP